MSLFQSADVLSLTGLTRNQLREWTGRDRRGLLSPDVEANGPGRHALYSWQTVLVLRVLLVLHNDFAVEVGAWAPAARELREKLDRVSFPTLWRSAVLFDSSATAAIIEDVTRVTSQGVIIPLEPHLKALSARAVLPRPDQFALFPPMAVPR